MNCSILQLSFNIKMFQIKANKASKTFRGFTKNEDIYKSPS